MMDTVDKIKYLCREKNVSGSLFCRKLLSLIVDATGSCQAILYVRSFEENGEAIFRYVEGYAYYTEKDELPSFRLAEGLNGQAAYDCKPLLFYDLPSSYLTVVSGLGQAHPQHLVIFPFVNGGNETLALIELAAFTRYDAGTLDFLNGVSEEIVKTIGSLYEQKGN